jgi:hypothetical protein
MYITIIIAIIQDDTVITQVTGYYKLENKLQPTLIQAITTP